MSISKVLATATLMLAALPVHAEQRLTGTWLTQDKTSNVRFQPCGAEDCGQIVWLRDPVDPETKAPWRDKHNSDAAKSQRPLMGLNIVTSLHSVGDGQWNGMLYNPLDGNSYSGSLRIVAADRLELSGCALFGLLCQTETWTLVTQ